MSDLTLEERIKLFEEKRQAKIDRFKTYAIKAETKSESLYNHARSMASCIPFGQPILIGHHSEKRDRRFRDRIHNTFEKSFEAKEKAEYYESKAERIESNNSIDSSDPLAIEKLKSKIKALEDNKEFMKKVNKEFKKDMTLKNIDLSDELKQEILNNLKIHHWDKKPFPSYALTNINTRIKSIKDRIEALSRAESFENFIVNDIKVTLENNYIIVDFPKKPDEATRSKIKSSPLCLKWSNYSKMWVRKYTGQGLFFTNTLREVLEKASY